MRTTARGRDVLLYDGACTFCTRWAARLLRWLPAGEIDALSFREPGALARFPGVSAERCERALQLVRADGRVFEGAEGLVQALRRRRWGLFARAYYAPGIRQLADAAYRLTARNRFRLGGGCAGACAAPPRRPTRPR
jgi:predicted DCC family thiol-disulfide oxidoreductase YuxK